MSYTAVYYRLHKRNEQEFASEEDARSFLFAGADNGLCADGAVIGPDGTETPFDYSAEADLRDPG